MRAQKSVHAGNAKIDFNVDFTHKLCAAMMFHPFSLCIKHPNLFGKSEKLDLLWDKALCDSSILITYRKPRPEWLSQHAFIIQHSVSPEIGIHGIPVDNFSRSGSGGVNLCRFSAGVDLSEPASSNWSSKTSFKFESMQAVEKNYKGTVRMNVVAKVKNPAPPNSDTLLKEHQKYFDEVIITVRSGDGGHGTILSLPNQKAPTNKFEKEKHNKTKKRVSYKRDFDGSLILPVGGNGGDVIIYADESKDTLLEFHQKRQYNAKQGGNVDAMGVLSSQSHNGLAAPALRIPVPLGTVVKLKRGKLLADLAQPGGEVVVAKGGQGGISLLEMPEHRRKNRMDLTNSILRDPSDKVLLLGQPGEEHSLQLILRVVADVGLVGLPNAGKSSLLAAITFAKPEIADYPFTTLIPNLGPLNGDPILGRFAWPNSRGSSWKGRNFLWHLRRTRLLVHVVDAAREDPVGDYRTVKEELRMYNPEYLERPYIVVLNKIDIPEALQRLPKLSEEIWQIGSDKIADDEQTGTVPHVKEIEEYQRPLAVVGVSVLNHVPTKLPQTSSTKLRAIFVQAYCTNLYLL